MEVELVPHYTLLTLFSVYSVFTVYTIQTALHCLNSSMDAWKHTLRKSPINVTGATIPQIWRLIWNFTMEKSRTTATNAIIVPEAAKVKRLMRMHSGEKQNNCYQCSYESSQAANLRQHLKIHTGEKYNKYNPSSLRRHLKTHTDEKSSQKKLPMWPRFQKVW